MYARLRSTIGNEHLSIVHSHQIVDNPRQKRSNRPRRHISAGLRSNFGLLAVHLHQLRQFNPMHLYFADQLLDAAVELER